jgi:sugar phosphate permease
MWYHRRLGTVSGVRAVVVYVSWVPLPALTLWLFDAIGWRQTWALYGALIAVVLPSLSWALVRDRPEDLGLHLDGAIATAPTDPGTAPGHSLHSAMRTPAYWALAFVSMLAPMVGTAMLFDLEPLLAARSMDATVAASCASAWSATMAIAALPTGWLVDRVSARHVVGTGVALLAASCLLLGAAESAPAALAAMTALGVGTTFVGSAVATTTARHFGREHHGAIRSSLGRIAVIATGLGPLAFGVSQRLTGAVAAALYCFAALCVPAATCVLALPRKVSK